MALTLSELNALIGALGLDIGDDILAERAKAEQFAARMQEISSGGGNKPPTWPWKQEFDDLLKQAQDAAGQRQYGAALKLLEDGAQTLEKPDPPPAPPPPPPIDTAAQQRFQAGWQKSKPAIDEVDQALAAAKYGAPPRGKIGRAATAYQQAKGDVQKAEQANDFPTAEALLGKLDTAIQGFHQAKDDQLQDERGAYVKAWEQIKGKVEDYTGQFKDADSKLPKGAEADAVTKLNRQRNLQLSTQDYASALATVQNLVQAVQAYEAVAGPAIQQRQQTKGDLARIAQPEGIVDSDKEYAELVKEKFALRKQRVLALVAQMDKALKDDKLKAEFKQAATAYTKAKTTGLAELKKAVDKEKPDIVEGNLALDRLEVAISAFEAEIQKATKANIQAATAGKTPPLDKKALSQVKETATRYAKLNPAALKGVDAKILDQLVGSVGEKAKSDDSKALVKASLVARYDLTGMEGDLTTKALPRLYKVMGQVPESHGRDNPLMKKVKRQRPGLFKDEKSSFYNDGYIFLSLERTGKNKEAFDQDKDVDPAFKVDRKEHSRFDAVTLHEIGHAVDDKNRFMAGNGATPTYGGWRNHGKLSEIAEAIGDAKGFFSDFKQSRALLRAYLVCVLEGKDPAAELKGNKMSMPEPGSTVIGRDELLKHPAVLKAETLRQKFLTEGWDAAVTEQTYDDLKKTVSVDAKTSVVYATIRKILAASASESRTAAKAADEALVEFNSKSDVDVTAAKPDWAAFDKHDATKHCKEIRMKGDDGLWEKAGVAKAYVVKGRVYQQAYKSQWVSYDFAARKQGVSSYQFRAPGEWFAEAYSAFFLGKLPKAHPLHAWLTNEVQSGKKG